jgi:genome maintenance exonuclease 1
MKIIKHKPRNLFKHLNYDLGYADLEALTREDVGRRYYTPSGESFPSITTVLSAKPNPGLEKWRERVGEAEAAKISYRASTRGTAVHSIIEQYLDNKFSYAKEFTPDILATFLQVQSILDIRVGTIYAQECALWSEYLGIAGRVDCVAEFDGVLSIIDFKTSKREKPASWCESYFQQEAAYAIMWEERTGLPIEQLVTIIAVDEGNPQVFIQCRDDWTTPLMESIQYYKSVKNI